MNDIDVAALKNDYDVLTDRRLAWLLSESQHAADCDRSIFLHPTSGLNSGTLVFELGKGWKKFRRRATP